MYLKTERCVIRPMIPEDAEALHAVLSDDLVMRYIEPLFDRAKTEAFIREAGMCVPPMVYAVVWNETGGVIGHVIFHDYDGRDCEIGWILNRRFWGMGIADELTAALVKHAQGTGFSGCVIECDPRQAATGHIALKNGFVFEGIFDGLERYCLILNRQEVKTPD